LIQLYEYLDQDSLASIVTAPTKPAGLTAFHLAACSGKADVVIMLHSKVKKPNLVDANGRSPLHFAALLGHADVANTLMQKGALVAAQERVNGRTPVHLAAQRGHRRCVRVLLENTEDSTAADAKDKLGRTPLMLAAARGHAKCAEDLLKNGANASASDARGRTSLMRAAVVGHEELVELLLESDGEAAKMRDRRGKSAFHVAAAAGQNTALMALAQANCAKEMMAAEDRKGRTPLHWAAYGGHDSCVDFILDEGKNNDNIQDFGESESFSPVHCAM